ncbi:MAG: hypothetical protein GXP40_08850 [Chloroflexi bacterium]|nr:hypothetical protein [Chloroflexota bacterium]
MNKHPLFLLGIALVLTLLTLACGGVATPTEEPAEPIATQPPEVAIEPPSTAEDFDARYTSKLVTLGELNAIEHPLSGGWEVANPAGDRYDDGLCLAYPLQANPAYVLLNCIFDSAPDYNVASLQEYYDGLDLAVDLKGASQYTYETDYLFYAYHQTDGFPKYTLILEQDGFILGASLVTPNLKLGDTLAGQFENSNLAIDDLLHQVILINLGKMGGESASAQPAISGTAVGFEGSLPAGRSDGFAVLVTGGETLRSQVTPQSGLDVRLEIWDIDKNVKAFVDSAPAGGKETLTYTVPQEEGASVYYFVIISTDGAGDYDAKFHATSGAVFSLRKEYLVFSAFEEGGYALLSVGGKAGETVTMDITPYPEGSTVDLVIEFRPLGDMDTVVQTANESGAGEPEHVVFTFPEDGAYFLKIMDANEEAGEYYLSFSGDA